MLAALTLYHFAGQGIQALPVSELTTVLRTFEPPSDCNDLHQCRTIWNIIWSCLTTIFACTWIALTMNIPGQGEGPLVAVLRKVGVMGLAVIAPEVVIAWAMRQWLVARRIANGVFSFLLQRMIVYVPVSYRTQHVQDVWIFCSDGGVCAI
jgi:ABC-type spermidine/putrescine transport system permease subunit II